MQFGEFVFLRLKNAGLRTLDHLGAKAMYLTAVAFEKSGKLSDMRPLMLEAYKACCLRKDIIGQSTIYNIILRSYL
jgi:hypothetical protein